MHIFLSVSRLAHKGRGRQSQNLETSTDGMKTKINFVNSLKHDINLVQNIVKENKSIDSIVDNFSTFITDRAKPFFKKSSKLTRKIYLYVQILSGNRYCILKIVKKKKKKKQEAIRNSNLQKNEQNRRKVFACRKDYKYYCRKCKSKFKRDRCKQMNDLRKRKPKEFWKLVKRKNFKFANKFIRKWFLWKSQTATFWNCRNNPEEVLNFIYFRCPLTMF